MDNNLSITPVRDAQPHRKWESFPAKCRGVSVMRQALGRPAQPLIVLFWTSDAPLALSGPVSERRPALVGTFFHFFLPGWLQRQYICSCNLAADATVPSTTPPPFPVCASREPLHRKFSTGAGWLTVSITPSHAHITAIDRTSPTRRRKKVRFLVI